MTIGERIKKIRKTLQLNQVSFAEKINLKQAAIGLIENNQRNVSDRVIHDICLMYQVNEDWLRFEKGEMFAKPDTFSLDEYAKLNGMTDLELDVIKCYLQLPADVRKLVLEHFKKYFSSTSVTLEENPDTFIEKELNSYREELEAEYKGEGKLPALQNLKEIKDA